MGILKTIFPYSFNTKSTGELIAKIIIYVVCGFVVGLLANLLDSLPIIGRLFSVAGWLLDIYVVVGIILALLSFFKVIK
ncbi:MAG: hypothetical protein IJL87_00465 [Clostridia bacterium]|nr:hypothetical protein [Clostridia bacterium]